MITRIYLATQNYLISSKYRRHDRGASMLEYVGVLVVVALIATAIFGVFNEDLINNITTAIRNSINSILNQGGGDDG